MTYPKYYLEVHAPYHTEIDEPVVPEAESWTIAICNSVWSGVGFRPLRSLGRHYWQPRKSAINPITGCLNVYRYLLHLPLRERLVLLNFLY